MGTRQPTIQYRDLDVWVAEQPQPDAFDFKAMEAADTSGDGGRDVLIGGAGPDTEPYNGDGKVDAADYVVWRTSSPPATDAQTDYLGGVTVAVGDIEASTNNLLNFTKVMLKQDQDPTDGGDAFDFQTSEPTTAQGQPTCYLRYTLDRANETGDGKDDLVTYQPDSTAGSWPSEVEDWTVIVVTDHGLIL